MKTFLEHGGAIAFGLQDLVPSRLTDPVGSGAGAWYRPKVYLHEVRATKLLWPETPWVEASWVEHLNERFSLLRTLEVGWDGHKAPAISEEILASAWMWLRMLSRSVQYPPSVVPTNTGGIAFEWHRSGMDLEIELLPGGEHYVSYEDTEGNEIEGPIAANIDAVAKALASLI